MIVEEITGQQHHPKDWVAPWGGGGFLIPSYAEKVQESPTTENAAGVPTTTNGNTK